MDIERMNRLLELIDKANEYTRLYDLGTPAITDQEWDNIYFEIEKLENELNIYPQNSPTRSIPYEVVNALKKVEHNHKMLSLQKTKDLNEVKSFIENKPSLAMCKMDGLTCSLTYVDGYLTAAETRGNGIVGEDILHNVLHLKSVPRHLLGLRGKVVIDGEIICTLTDFEMFASDYKNPRNFAAGSIRLLDSKECAQRKLTFVAWDVIEGFDHLELLSKKLDRLKREHFIVVPYQNLPAIDADGNEVPLDIVIEQIQFEAQAKGFPIDGAVFKFDNIAYSKSLGETSHHFKNAIAYKFYDEVYETKLIDIEWTMGRTGVLTPVAVFEPIDIDGSTVERASLHNISVMIDTLHGYGWKGQKVEVFKANMIIPQIASAEKDDDRCKYYFDRVAFCPICGHEVILKNDNGTTFAICSNDTCEGKLINRLDHFCGKKGLDIKGLSKATLEKVIDWGWVSNRHRLFMLKFYRDEWIKKPGFGEKSVDKILEAIDSASCTEFHQYLSSLSIPLIGVSASKELAKHFKNYAHMRTAMENDFKFYELPNFGIEMHKALYNYDWLEADAMVGEHAVTFKDSIATTKNQDNTLDGLTFVITGKLSHFKNRDAIKDKIESLGGKVTGSVSKNTSYLINNDKNSTSSKNKSAKTLGIPILSEEDFIQTFGIE